MGVLTGDFLKIQYPNQFFRVFGIELSIERHRITLKNTENEVFIWHSNDSGRDDATLKISKRI
jgi:hypothetical protein